MVNEHCVNLLEVLFYEMFFSLKPMPELKVTNPRGRSGSIDDEEMEPVKSIARPLWRTGMQELQMAWVHS